MPALRTDILARLSQSADALVAASRRRIYAVVQDGRRRRLSDRQILDEIMRSLETFTLPPAQRQRLRGEVRSAMSELAQAHATLARSVGPGGVALNADEVLALADVTIPKVQQELRRTLQTELRRAVNSGSGVDALEQRLKKRGYDNVKSLANTAVAQFNNALTFRRAEAAGITRFRYDGPVNPRSRRFCIERVGQTFTLEQIEQMDNGQGLPVKEACGGYNCRHYWTAVI